MLAVPTRRHQPWRIGGNGSASKFDTAGNLRKGHARSRSPDARRLRPRLLCSIHSLSQPLAAAQGTLFACGAAERVERPAGPSGGAAHGQGPEPAFSVRGSVRRGGAVWAGV